jgi:hypothetical protein
MKDITPVETQSEPSSRIQFGKNSDYRVIKTLNHTHLKIAAGVLVAIVIFAVMAGPPDPPLPINRDSGIKTPEYMTSSPENVSLDLENFSESYQKPAPNQKSKGQRREFSGPEALTRQEKVFFEPGTALKAQIVSGGSLGYVKAKLFEELPNTPLKNGSLLIGKAEVTDDRILVHFTKAIVENKYSYAINAEIADPKTQESGIEISLWEKYSKKFGLSAGLYMITGVADTLQDRENIGGQVVVKPTIENAALGGIKTSSLETAHDILNDQKNKDIKPNLKLGLPVLIIFDGEIEPMK